MNYMTVNSHPFYCLDCHELFVANRFDREIVCPNCESADVLAYSERSTKLNRSVSQLPRPSEWMDGPLNGGEFICPQCGNYSMRFMNVGCWD